MMAVVGRTWPHKVKNSISVDIGGFTGGFTGADLHDWTASILTTSSNESMLTTAPVATFFSLL